jgi:hypothetical protein
MPPRPSQFKYRLIAWLGELVSANQRRRPITEAIQTMLPRLCADAPRTKLAFKSFA